MAGFGGHMEPELLLQNMEQNLAYEANSLKEVAKAFALTGNRTMETYLSNKAHFMSSFASQLEAIRKSCEIKSKGA